MDRSRAASPTSRSRSLVRRTRRLWAVVVVVVASLLSSAVGASSAVRLDEQVDRVSVSGRLALVEDADGRLAIEAVRALPDSAFTPGSGRVANFGMTQATIWARLRVINAQPSPQTWWLSIDNPTLDEIGLFVGDDPPRWTGRSLPKQQRDLPRSVFTFRLDLPPHADVPIHLRFRSLNEMHL